MIENADVSRRVFFFFQSLTTFNLPTKQWDAKQRTPGVYIYTDQQIKNSVDNMQVP